MKKLVFCFLVALLILNGCSSEKSNDSSVKSDAYTDVADSAFNQSQVSLKVQAND